MTAPSQLRLLTLNEGENHEVTLFRLERGWTLHFVLGPSLAAKNVRVFTNHPLDAKSGPNRYLYREIGWQNVSGCRSDVYDDFAEVKVIMAGSFNYYFTINGKKGFENASGKGYFLVDPVLRVGQYDERLPLDCITCQTVLAKNLGPFDSWENRLRIAKESGYNMIHFTPIQELGASNSAYALKDQLKLNPVFSPGTSNFTLDDVDHLVKKMKSEWEILSLTDLVFNHTANESVWIQDHPECVYNLVNSPHLKPAYLLDRILWHFSMDVAEGRWTEKGIPACVSSEEHLHNIRNILHNEILPSHNICQYYLIHIDDTILSYRQAIAAGVVGVAFEGKDLEILHDPKYRRLKSTVNIPHAIHLFYDSQPEYLSDTERLENSCGSLRYGLDQLNAAKFSEIQSHLDAAVNNFIANVKWRFVDEHGEKLGCVDHSKERPLMFNYFTLPKQSMTLAEEEGVMEKPEAAFCMAHNGWVMDHDPLKNFAEPGSNIYLRRELIPWGDSVKLRYGNEPKDCPFLWEHMRKYTCEAARVFHGVRLDNCHSTPIHVAEFMLDEARKVRPDLYVIAELFTSSEDKDNTFINRLGLTSLIREALGAWDSHEQGRLVHRYGGQPVGAFMLPPARALVPCMAHAIFLDQTHDNPSPVEKRTALDLLPSSAMVAMACCATGSNRGYDELVPHHINVVTESRLYQSWSNDVKLVSGRVNKNTGIIAAKQALNKLHQTLGQTGFSQVFVDQVDRDTVSITRHNPVSHQSVILVSRTVFSHTHSMDNYSDTLSIPGVIEEVIMEAHLSPRNGGDGYERDNGHINGLPGYNLHLRQHFSVTESSMVEVKVTSNDSVQELEFVQFPPGSVIAFKVALNPTVKSHILKVRQALSHFGYRMRTISGRNLDEIRGGSTLEDILADMNLSDIARALYRCDAEERDDGKGFGAYDVPGFGPFVYCGIQGMVSVLHDIRYHNDLGHPMCDNLRQGNWMMDYTANRLQAFPGTQLLGEWLANVFSHLKEAPRYLVPCYFDAIIKGVHMLLVEVAHAKMPSFIRDGSTFLRHLALGSLQFCSYVPTARLPPLSPNLTAPQPESVHNAETGLRDQLCVSISAGLPHFSSGIFRNWGRDTFISLRGLLLIPGRFEEARFIILAYAGCLRHGLIPNLLGSGTHARYNCRDAIWWWLQCLQEYCNMAPNGTAILDDQVSRMYPTDDAQPENPGIHDQKLSEVIQEAIQRHADGIQYTERNAGPAIDNDMSAAGFEVKVGVDWNTGFVFGGNEHNCGTWMDKNGSSERAGNKGKPATPRDGSAVELVGLCRAAVRWLAGLHGAGLYSYPGVNVSKNGGTIMKTWVQWGALIEENFERHFWINTEADPENERRPDLINRRGIFKDSVGASQCWADYQLRPNFPIAMVVAPELFTPERAWKALTLMRDVLVGPLGMKTLDPSDWSYNGFYINSDDSDDPKKARGFNYHQGPEWVWPMGFFLRALLYFAQKLDSSCEGLVKETATYINTTLSKHNVHIHASPWRSLPELTNKDGAVCHDSCLAQAWSMACILEVLHDMEAASC